MEGLGLMASFERQRHYEVNVPIADVPTEVLSSWDDYVNRERLEDYGPPVFSIAEVEAMRSFQSTFETTVRELPKRLPPLKEAQALLAWQRLRDAAAVALQIFEKRGMLSEDEPIRHSGV